MAEKVIGNEQARRTAHERNAKLLGAMYAHLQEVPAERVLDALKRTLDTLRAMLIEAAQKTSDEGKRGATGQAKELRSAAGHVNVYLASLQQFGLPDADIIEQDMLRPEEPFGEDSPAPMPTVTQIAQAAVENPGADLETAVSLATTAFLSDKPATNGDWTKVAQAGPKVTATDNFGGAGTLPVVSEEPIVHEQMPAPAAHPFAPAVEQPKRDWAGANLPDVPVFSLFDDPGTWKPAPPRRSHSQLSKAENCGMAYWLKYRRGAPERPSWANVGGNTLHECVQVIEKAESADTDTWGPERVALLWAETWAREVARVEADSPLFSQNTWRASNGGREDAAWWAAEGPEMVHRYLEWRDGFIRSGWSVLVHNGAPAIELEFQGMAGGSLTHGFIDSIWVNAERTQLLFLDLKSGRTMPAEHSQLAEYAQGAKFVLGDYEAAGLEAVGAYWNARSGHRGSVVRLSRQHPAEEIGYRYLQLAKMDQAEVYMPNTSGGYGGCGACPLVRSCPVGSKK